MYKFGLHLYTYVSCMDDDSLKFLPRLKEMGYDGCEIPLVAEHLQLLTPSKVRKKLKELNMSCVTGTGINPDMSIISENNEIRLRGINHLKKCIDMTAEMDAPLICGALYAPIGIRPKSGPTPKEWELSVKGLREVARYAAQKGITLGLEPLNRYENFFINVAEDAVTLIKDIGEPNIKVHLDTYHMNIEEKNIYQTVLNTGHLVGHIHCSENDRGIPGTGHIDWDGLFKALKEIQYDGWCVIESFFEPIPHISDLTPIWRKLAPDADTLSKQGLDFIKSKTMQIT